LIAVLFILPLTFLAAGEVAAQPGDRRTPEEIKAALESKLEAVSEKLNEFPERGDLYLDRARVYVEFYYRSEPEEQEVYADKALADLDRAVELWPDVTAPLVERARFRALIDPLSWFNAIVADDLKVIERSKKNWREIRRLRLDEQGVAEEIAGLYYALSNLYASRGQRLSENPRFIPRLNPQPAPYSPWQDFDTATEYAQKAVLKPEDLLKVVGTRLAKGSAAYNAREYEVALAAYQSDEQYLGEDYYLLCENNNSKQICAFRQRDTLLTFSHRRAQVYLKLHQPQNALAELKVYFDNAYQLECADIFRLRAEAYRQSGNEKPALADEERALTYGSRECLF
jgi:tetratricopeptide (TPR) repeat protein